MADKPTGYQACQEMVELILIEQANLKVLQRRRTPGRDYSGAIAQLSRSCAVLQSEIRKTGDDADEAARNLPPKRRLQLILRLIRELEPEYRAPIQIFLTELGSGLQ